MTKSQRLAHVESWRNSGISRPAYCREHGIKYPTFISWFKLGHKSKDQDSPKSGKFVALSESLSSPAIEILFPNGTRLVYSGSLTSELIQLLRDV